MRFEIYRDKSRSREWRWRLWANNKKIASSGEGYKRERDCRHGINLVKGAADAPVYDEEGNRLDDDGVLDEVLSAGDLLRKLNVVPDGE